MNLERQVFCFVSVLVRMLSFQIYQVSKSSNSFTEMLLSNPLLGQLMVVHKHMGALIHLRDTSCVTVYFKRTISRARNFTQLFVIFTCFFLYSH